MPGQHVHTSEDLSAVYHDDVVWEWRRVDVLLTSAFGGEEAE